MVPEPFERIENRCREQQEERKGDRTCGAHQTSEKRDLKKDGLEAIMRTLHENFDIQRAEANKRFRSTRISLTAVAENPDSLTQFFQKKVRYLRYMGDIRPDNTGWNSALYNV